MKRMGFLAMAMMFLLCSSGCGHAEESPGEAVSDPVLGSEQAAEPSEPAALTLTDLNETLHALDPAGASLTYRRDTEKTYGANEAIRAETYLERLKSFAWKEYVPSAEGDGNAEMFYRLTTPDAAITVFLGGSGSNRPIQLITEKGEGWFIRSDPEADGLSRMTYDIFASWFEEAETASYYGGAGTPLTPEELDWFEKYTEATWTEYDAGWGGYVSGATEISCFFTSRYSDPRDMDAEAFLYYCPDRGTLGLDDEDEWQLVQKKVDWRVGEDNHLATIGEMPVPAHRLPRTYINEILTKYAGITVEEMHTDWFEEALYIPETDCFYTFSSDFGPGMFSPCYGERSGDTVTLWNEPARGGALVLQKNGENWHILSHNDASIEDK